MNTRKTIRIAGRILIVILVLILLVLGVGDFAINRYLNADGRRDLGNYLPINGTATYDKVSLHPFRDFPHLSVRLQGVKLADSLAAEHQYPPVALDQLNVRVSVMDWRQKQIAVESIDLDGLTLNLFDRADGYSNIGSLIQKKIEKTKAENKNDGFSVVSVNSEVNISDVQLTKIDEINGQQAGARIEHILVKNVAVDSIYKLALEIDKATISDLSSKPGSEDPLRLDQAIAHVGLNKSFSRLSLENILLKNGHIHLHRDSTGQSNYANLFGEGKNNSKDKNKKTGGMIMAIDGAHVELDNIDFALIDFPKNKHLEARLVKVQTELHTGSDTSALVNVELDVDQLGFNTKKGAYLSESQVQGEIQAIYSHEGIVLNSPTLRINDEAFDVKARLYTDNKTPTTLTIEKQDARTATILPVLTSGIRDNISDYEVGGPFYAKAHILFTPGKKDPRVEVDLQVDNKTVIAKGQTINNAKLSATFINRIYDDHRQFGEDRRNVRLKIHHIKGGFNDLYIESENALLTSTLTHGDYLIARAKITDQAASASKFLKHDNFYFQDGQFTLSTDINGSLNNMDELITRTNLNLAMDDLEVYYPAGNTVLPFRILEIKKNGEKTMFVIEGFTKSYQRPFQISGEIDHVEALLFPERRSQLQTEANIRASSISWEGVIALFGKEGIFSSAKKDSSNRSKQSMKQTLSGIQQSFHPIVRVVIDTVFYGKDIQLLDFNTGIKFDDERTLVLEETKFKIDKSNISLDGEVIINQLDFTQFDFDIELNHLDFDALMPKFDYFGVHLIKQIRDQPDNLSMQVKLSGELDDREGLRPESINAYITYESFAEDKFSGSITLKANPATKRVEVIFGHSGHPRNFNHLLETDAYRFDKGWYTTSFQFDDNFESVAQMVEESTFGLTISDAEVYISELGVKVPLSRIEVASIDNMAYYYIMLQSDSLNQDLAFSGTVENIRHFAFDDTDDPYEVDLQISSSRLVWANLIKLFAFQNQGSEHKGGKILKESLTKVLRDFNPNVNVTIDKLEYSDRLHLNNIYAHAYLDQDLLKIDSVQVSYGDSRIDATIHADMGHEVTLPFDMQLQLSNIHIGNTLDFFDYFNVAELREAKQIDGNIWFNLDMSAEMDLENKGFITDKTRADIGVELQDMVIEDLHTIDTIAERMGKEKRFELIRFAPIDSRIHVRGERIEIEETEIQSNAIHAFVEGTLDKHSPENLWISLPLQNLKKPDLEHVPKKTGYAGGGKKIYLQWISSQSDDDGKMKVRLRKKKFFQERFHAKDFRAYKREIRRERRRLKRERE